MLHTTLFFHKHSVYLGQSGDFSNFSLAYYMLNNRTCYHGRDLIPTSEGPTRTRHGKKSETPFNSVP